MTGGRPPAKTAKKAVATSTNPSRAARDAPSRRASQPSEAARGAHERPGGGGGGRAAPPGEPAEQGRDEPDLQSRDRHDVRDPAVAEGAPRRPPQIPRLAPHPGAEGGG